MIEDRNRRMLRARDTMDRAYAQPLDIPAIARVAHVSPSHFSRQFRATFGETPHRYLQRRRVERAMELLSETERPVTEICFDVGFASLGTFSRTFRAVVGESPSRYRARFAGEGERGSFAGGAFVVTEDRSGVTALALARGRAASRTCAAGSRPAAKGAAANPKVLRLLHGSAHGKFRTVGRYAAATVPGTAWTTADGCGGTMISDHRGQVATQSSNAELSYSLIPGAQSIYRCAAKGQPPVSRAYCLAVLTEDITSIVNGQPVRSFDFVTGVATESQADVAELCVAGPQQSVCTAYPLTPTDRAGFRLALAGCVPTQGPGGYSLTWMVDGVALGAPLVFNSPVGAESQTLPDRARRARNRRPVPRVGGRREAGNSLFASTPGLRARDQCLSTAHRPVRAATAAGSHLCRRRWHARLAARNHRRSHIPIHGVARLVRPEVASNATTDNPSGLLLLQPGAYWIGVIAGADPGVAGVAYDPVPADLTYNPNAFTGGPSDPFGPLFTRDERLSMYMSYYAPPLQPGRPLGRQACGTAHESTHRSTRGLMTA